MLSHELGHLVRGCFVGGGSGAGVHDHSGDAIHEFTNLRIYGLTHSNS
jgi:hypothetical protein